MFETVNNSETSHETSLQICVNFPKEKHDVQNQALADLILQEPLHQVKGLFFSRILEPYYHLVI